MIFLLLHLTNTGKHQKSLDNLHKHQVKIKQPFIIHFHADSPQIHYLPVKTVILLVCMVLWKAESFQPLAEASQKSQSLHGGAVPALLWHAKQSEWRDVYGQMRKKGTKIQIQMP